jgi:Zn-finger nucleic acid-binding protein
VRNFDPSDASGLDLELRCPRCGAHATLVEMKNDAGESRCSSCGGSHLDERGTRKVLVELAGLPARTLDVSGRNRPGTTRCPSCHTHTASIPIHKYAADVCGKCSTAWFEPGVLFAVTGGKFGSRSAAALEPSRAGAPPRRSPPQSASARAIGRARPMPKPSSGGKFFGILMAVCVLVILGGGGSAWFLFFRTAPAPASKTPPAPQGFALDTPPTGGADLVNDYPFGGRTVIWWSTRLTILKNRSDEKGRALYALTKKRAEANGLTVDETGAEVTVKPSPALMGAIGARLGVK